MYGIPKVHYKGQQDDFYIMVRRSWPACCPCVVGWSSDDDTDTDAQRGVRATLGYCVVHVAEPSITLRCFVQVMDLLGPSLWDMWNQSGQHLTETYVACVAMEALTILQALHLKG